MRWSDTDGELTGPRQLVRRLGGAERPVFSLCVMLTNWEEYGQCMDSFLARGFSEDNSEFLVLDNSAGNRADAYVTLNEFLGSARGDYIVLCHQDVLLIDQGYDDLLACMEELNRTDPSWGLCGNAGHSFDGWPAICISHPNCARDIQGAPFPARVMSLDENFMVARRIANLALSRDLSGFHHYGADLCIVADILGWTCHVINFFLRHNSGGNFDARYHRSRALIAQKYQRALRPRWVHLITRYPFFISGLRYHPPVATALRKLGKSIGVYPRLRDVEDPAVRARFDRRRGKRAD